MNTRPAATATAAMSHATRRTSRSSGLGSRAPRCDSAAIRPSSVRIPVARTRPTSLTAGAQRPAEHGVPGLERRGVGVLQAGGALHGRRLAAQRGHVHLDGAGHQQRVPPRRGRPPPAGARRRSRAPRAGTAQRTPSRSTVACGGRNWRSASMARSACRSWITATAAFSTTTQTIAIASVPVPARAARPAAAQSSSARGWTIWAATCRGQAAPPRRSSSFGPWAWSRRAASRDVSPDGSERRSRKSRSTGSSGGPELTARRPSRRCAASAGR